MCLPNVSLTFLSFYFSNGHYITSAEKKKKKSQRISLLAGISRASSRKTSWHGRLHEAVLSIKSFLIKSECNVTVFALPHAGRGFKWHVKDQPHAKSPCLCKISEECVTDFVQGPKFA